MQEIQLYIKNPSTSQYERLDLFGKDSITVTESIKNAKDISKVFTTFSQQFSIPASKTNSKIFKHYYNYHITSGFDARKKVDAKLDIDHTPFKVGKIKLDGVDMRNNSPYAYKITFYGSVIELKDLLGEDKLPSLTALDIDMPYNGSKIKTNLTQLESEDQNGTGVTGVTLPLITHSQRLYYDSATGSKQSGNLHVTGSYTQGVKFDQLKYAVKLRKILDAIETKYSAYNLEFASDSFFKAAGTDFQNLYMWCHRKKGGVDTEADPIYTRIEDFNFTPTYKVLKVVTPDDWIVQIDTANYSPTALTFTTNASSSAFPYDILIYKKASGGSSFSLFQEQRKVYGTKIVTVTDTLSNGNQYYAVIRTYEEPASFSSIVWQCTSTGGTDTYTETSISIEQSYFFNIAANLPEMKIIDFLSSVFQMFNLVAYVDINNKIQVKTLDDFYTTTQRNIDKYIDIGKSQVDVALPYKEIFFKYADTKTIIAEQHYQEIAQVDPTTGRGPFEWGAVEYTDAAGLSGDTYKMEPAFHHAKFEKLIDNGDGLTDTGIQVGYFVDDNEESYLGSPLIFFVNAKNANVSISLLERAVQSTILSSSTLNMPSNTADIDDETSNNIHFNTEKSEYTGVDAEETLFKRFYQSYIENVFNASSRIIKVSTILPVGVLVRIELSDVILMGGQKYRINSYKTNIKTGQTDFELINYYD